MEETMPMPIEEKKTSWIRAEMRKYKEKKEKEKKEISIQGGKKRTHKNKRKSMKKKSMKKKHRKTMKKGNKYPGYKKNGGKRKNNRITKKRRKKGGNEGNEEYEGNEGKSWTCRIGETLEDCKNRARSLIRAGIKPVRDYTGMEYLSWLEDSYQKQIEELIEQLDDIEKAAKRHEEQWGRDEWYERIIKQKKKREELIPILMKKVR